MILSREYYEDVDMEPEEVVAMAFTFLLQKKEPRHTEGRLDLWDHHASCASCGMPLLYQIPTAGDPAAYALPEVRLRG